MVLDSATLKTQAVSLGEPVMFEGADAEEFLAESRTVPLRSVRRSCVPLSPTRAP